MTIPPSPIASYHVLGHFFDFHVLFIILFTTYRQEHMTKPPQPKTASQVLGFYVSLHFLQTMTYRCMPADSITYCQKKLCYISTFCSWFLVCNYLVAVVMVGINLYEARLTFSNKYSSVITSHRVFHGGL